MTESGWFKAMRGRRGRGPAQPDPGDMGTAFGLDSVTVVAFQPAHCEADRAAAPTPAWTDWQRRVTRRSGL